MEEDEYERLGKKLNVFIIYYLSSQFSWEMWNTSVKLKIYIFFYSKILCSPLDNLVYYCRLHVSLGHFLNSHRSLIPSEGVGVVGSMFAGSFAGTAEHIIMYPVDSVKVLIPGLDSRWIFSGKSKGFQSKRLRTSFVQWEV